MIFSITDTYYLIVSYILAGLLGLCVGSFLNVVIYRVPLHMSLVSPPSHCPQCENKIRWYDNIPVLSYCLLGGKCRVCKEHIPFRYTFVEITNTLLWLMCVAIFSDNVVYMCLSMIVCSVCLCVFFIDLEHLIIPDRFQIILAAAGVLAVFADTEYDWISHLIGLGAATAVFLAVGYAVSFFKKREALGGGDVKLAACAGLLLGWQKFILMMLLASVSASIYFVFKMRKDNESVETAFAPFLTFGLVISMLFGNFIINWYISLLVG